MAKDALYIVVTFILVIIGGFLVFERVSLEAEPIIEEELEEEETREVSAVSGSYDTEIDTVSSVLGWSAERTILKSHVNTGTLNLSSGTLSIEDGVLVGGEFVIDMSSLALTSVHGNDPATSGGSNLVKHISSEDLFDVEEYEESTFVITEVDENDSYEFGYDITGELTIKDETQEVTFPAELYVEEGILVAEGAVRVDRTQWGITYGSSNFFDDIGDMVISDYFDVDVLLFAPVPEAQDVAEDEDVVEESEE